jgi:hypothetical protein
MKTIKKLMLAAIFAIPAIANATLFNEQEIKTANQSQYDYIFNRKILPLLKQADGLGREGPTILV